MLNENHTTRNRDEKKTQGKQNSLPQVANYSGCLRLSIKTQIELCLFSGLLLCHVLLFPVYQLGRPTNFFAENPG